MNTDRYYFKGASESYDDCLWYLDTSASSHTIGKKLFFNRIDENQKGNVRFGDRSTIPYEGKGDILVTFKNDEEMFIQNVLCLLYLKTNILSMGKVDDQGCITILSNGFLTIYEKFGRFLTKTMKTKGDINQLKINISEKCNLTEDNKEPSLRHKRFCDRSFYTLQDIIRWNLVRGLPQIQNLGDMYATYDNMQFIHVIMWLLKKIKA